MRLLVCGGRNYSDSDRVRRELDAIHSVTPITCIIHGDASGADNHADMWAIFRDINTMRFPANWKTYGPAAGPIRNQQMLEDSNPTQVIAFGGGKGTADMIRRAKRAGLPVIEIDRQ